MKGEAELTATRRRFTGGLRCATLEALNASTGVDQLLLTRVERVALRTKFNVHLRLGRARGKRVTAAAGDLGRDVVWVDFSLHKKS
jgi:hypothetical protein